ncbi:MAG: hypothetical protein ACTHKB_08725 [Burkholderiaceae bacterium]
MVEIRASDVAMRAHYLPVAPAPGKEAQGGIRVFADGLVAAGKAKMASFAPEGIARTFTAGIHNS